MTTNSQFYQQGTKLIGFQKREINTMKHQTEYGIKPKNTDETSTHRTAPPPL
jgi:hypothetical protein